MKIPKKHFHVIQIGKVDFVTIPENALDEEAWGVVFEYEKINNDIPLA